MTTYGVAARRNSTEPGSMAYMAKDGPDITQKVLGDEAFNNKWGCKNNIELDGTKGPHREWRFGKCRDCGMGEGKYTQAFHCLLYTSPSPRDLSTSRMPSSA